MLAGGYAGSVVLGGAGLLCGPAAIVCTSLGILLGSLGGGWGGEWLYRWITSGE